MTELRKLVFNGNHKNAKHQKPNIKQIPMT